MSDDLLGGAGDLGGQGQRQDNERFCSISTHDQQISGFEPGIELAKAASPGFDLNPSIGAEQWKAEIRSGVACA
jgi:hypothetical protein